MSRVKQPSCPSCVLLHAPCMLRTSESRERAPAASLHERLPGVDDDGGPREVFGARGRKE